MSCMQSREYWIGLKETIPQGLKPAFIFTAFTARVNSCPFKTVPYWAGTAPRQASGFSGRGATSANLAESALILRRLRGAIPLILLAKISAELAQNPSKESS